MRMVVTGGAGFVGRHVVAAVLDAGHDCLVVDVAPLPPTLVDAGADFRMCSIASVADIRRAFRSADVVLHLAGVGDVDRAASQPALAAELNVVGSVNVAEACLAEGVGRLVYASTWEVYGRPWYEPIDESHPTNPTHPYSITKLAGERILLAYDALRDLPIVALRLGTVYGNGMRPNTVFSRFIRHALRGEVLTISGDGLQHRQFTHSSDIGSAFVAAAESGLRHEVMNIVAEQTVTIRQLAEMVVMHAPAPLAYGEPRPGDPSPALVSSARARALIGWQPRVPFEAGLRALVEEYRTGRTGDVVTAIAHGQGSGS
jgi:UDP-glucose 4-epimerase